MSWVTRLFRTGDSEEAVEQAACRHLHLSARWDEAADVGKEERASSYTCLACGETFTPEQALAIGHIPGGLDRVGADG